MTASHFDPDTHRKELFSEINESSLFSGAANIPEGTSGNNPPLMQSPAACGFPSPAEQYVETPLDLNELLVKTPAATFFVRASGDSMTGAGIRDGDILVVDRSIHARNGHIVIACVENEFTVKYLQSDEKGAFLVPANRKYPVISFREGMELKIFGVVTACIHQFFHLKTKSRPCSTIK